MEALRKTPFHVRFLISCGCLKFLEFFGLQTNLIQVLQTAVFTPVCLCAHTAFPSVFSSLPFEDSVFECRAHPIYNDCVWSPLIMFTKTHVPSKFLFTCSEWTCLFLGYFSVHDSYQRTFQDNPHNDCQETTFLHFFLLYIKLWLYTLMRHKVAL